VILEKSGENRISRIGVPPAGFARYFFWDCKGFRPESFLASCISCRSFAAILLILLSRIFSKGELSWISPNVLFHLNKFLRNKHSCLVYEGIMASEERKRLEEDKAKTKHWRRWGPYLSEREWGTVREDDSMSGEAWDAMTFERGQKEAYRWGEEGIAGICDNHQKICFSWVFWNGEDPILKDRLFGLSGKEGNHGEDVKEVYFYLDNTPTHSYMKYLYKYPQRLFPYEELRRENGKRHALDFEYDLIETGIFKEERYFDVEIEYAKGNPDEIWVRGTCTNRGPETKKLYLLPQLWFRNTWSWGDDVKRPIINQDGASLVAEHVSFGKLYLHFSNPTEILFTENETGLKDGFHRYIIQKDKRAITSQGTKSALLYVLELKPGESKTITCCLTKEKNCDLGKDVFAIRKKEMTEFYDEISPKGLSPDQKMIQQQALSGLLWNKQYYFYVVEEWLKKRHNHPRNKDWVHIYNEDILSVPDKWEYPCYFSWDTAFHALPLSLIDPEFAKRQLTLLTREWYMHPSGQIPAYEWSFSDVNPPVHAWASWRTYKIDKKTTGHEDRLFLEAIFQKLLLNFTWWVNRKDSEGKNVFQGGFLGLDNIGLFNRTDLPPNIRLFQSDATSWMAMYAMNMLTISLELAEKNPAYEDMASKFFEHFLYISHAANFAKDGEISLWDEQDGFYYDVMQRDSGEFVPIKVRSMVGLIPLFSVMTLETDQMNKFSGFRKRFEWFVENRRDLCNTMAPLKKTGEMGRRLLSLVTPERLKRVLEKMLDEKEFLSPYGIRSLSKFHQNNPYVLHIHSQEYRITYEPAESTVKLYGGNSNWRGPVWVPLNMLIIESLQKYHHYFGDSFKVECPTGSGHFMNLWDVAAEISKRVVKIFEKDPSGYRPVFGGTDIFKHPNWQDKILFYEYFHGDEGAGLGASHQTGWTALIAKLIQQLGEHK
jgi:hypothetical protein